MSTTARDVALAVGVIVAFSMIMYAIQYFRGNKYLEVPAKSFSKSVVIVGQNPGLSVDQLKKVCDSHPACMAFSTDGNLADISGIAPKNQIPCVVQQAGGCTDLYIKT